MGWGEPFVASGLSALDRTILRVALTDFIDAARKNADALPSRSKAVQRELEARRIVRAEELLKEL